MFFRSTNSKITPFWKPLTTHQSHRPRLQPWFCEMFPIWYVFQSNSQGTLDMRFPSIDLQCFKVCYFQMAGENSVETRMRREDPFFFEFFWIWNDFLSPQNTDDFPPKNCGFLIHSKTIALEVLRGGSCICFSLAMEMVDSCFIHTNESRRSVSFIQMGEVHSFGFGFLHLHFVKLSLKSSDSRHFDGISKEEKDLKKTSIRTMCRISKMKCRPITKDDRHISNNDRICQPKNQVTLPTIKN